MSERPDTLESFFRVYKTDAEGELALPAFPTADTLQAFGDQACSVPILSDGNADVTLVVHSSFRASGNVFIEDSFDTEGAPITVICGTDEGSVIAAEPAPAGGEWGPIEIPLMETERYSFKLDGGWVIPENIWVGRPEAGQELQVDLVARKGEPLWFQVVDAGDNLIPDAVVDVSWNRVDGSTSTRNTRRNDEYIWVGGIPPGPIHFEASAPGFAPSSGGPIEVPETEPTVRVIQLLQTGSMAGKCMKGGRPVPDFDIVYWPSLGADGQQTASFYGRQDGSFAVPDVQVGHTRLIAIATESASVTPVSVVVEATKVVEVELELLEPLRGKGRILDLGQRNPIAGAEVSVFSTGDSYPIRPWGEPTLANARGEFEVDGLSTAPQMLRVSADGFASAWVPGEGVTGDVADLGDVYLEKTQDLVLRIPPFEPFDPGHLSVECAAAGMPPKSFSRDGVVRYESIGPGSYDIHILDGQGDVYRVTLDLVLGEVWDVLLPVWGSTTLDITVVPEKGTPLPTSAWVMLEYVAAGKPLERGMLLSEDGHLVFKHLVDSTVAVKVTDGDFHRVYATSEVDLAGQASVEHRIQLMSALRVFHVVDRAEVPQPSIRLDFYQEGSGRPPLTSRTDANGHVEVALPESTHTRAVMFDPGRGTMASIAVSPDTDSGEPSRILFNPEIPLRIRYLDHEAPASGVQARIGVDGYPGAVAPSKRSDSNGYVEWPRLNRTEFVVETSSPHYWPTRSVLVPDVNVVHDVQVRGLGDLVVTVRDSMGLAISGALVDLRAKALQGDVAGWVQDGRVATSDSRRRTGGHGGIEFTGLPRDDYAVTVSMTDGTVWRGVVSVATGERARLDVVIP